MRAKRQDELIGIIKGGGAMRSYRICGRATSWKEIARWGKGKLSCLIEDEKGRVVAASPWSARTLNQWLGEVNAHFGRKNIAVVNLDPEVCWVVFTLRGWSAGWGYYPSEPPWRAAFLAQERGGAGVSALARVVNPRRRQKRATGADRQKEVQDGDNT